jgi:hypothetical protein
MGYPPVRYNRPTAAGEGGAGFVKLATTRGGRSSRCAYTTPFCCRSRSVQAALNFFFT